MSGGSHCQRIAAYGEAGMSGQARQAAFDSILNHRPSRARHLPNERCLALQQTINASPPEYFAELAAAFAACSAVVGCAFVAIAAFVADAAALAAAL
jgi:hypothetical protein